MSINVAEHEGDEFFDVDETTCTNSDSQFPSSHADREQLEKCGRWLLSIPRDDVVALRRTPEYTDFLKAFEKLGQAHRRVLAMTEADLDKSVPDGFSFLQHMAVDDVVLRVLEFLECQSLIRTSETCSRFRELTQKSATQRTHDIAKSRQLNHVMKLLRAKEEIDGSSSGTIIEDMNSCHVPVPILGLEKRVIVTDAGDPEFNGVYYCTGCDTNGFFFTKPRNREVRATTTNAVTTTPLQAMDNFGMLEQLMHNHTDVNNHDNSPGSGNSEEPTKPGELLRCIIAKRFSNTTLLWYMSKEVESANTEGGMPEIYQVYSYWANLMVAAPVELCRYPSQTSLLNSAGETAWQSLSNPTLTNPPTVEVLD